MDFFSLRWISFAIYSERPSLCWPRGGGGEQEKRSLSGEFSGVRLWLRLRIVTLGGSTVLTIVAKWWCKPSLRAASVSRIELTGFGEFRSLEAEREGFARFGVEYELGRHE